jgi:hypothetical protein
MPRSRHAILNPAQQIPLQIATMSPRLTRTALLWASIAYFGITYVLLDGGFVIERFFSLGVRVGEILSWSEYVSKRAAFLVVHLVAVGSLICLSLSRWRVFSVPALVIMFVITAFDLTYFLASNRFANLTDVAVLLEAVGHAPEALKEYQAAALNAFFLTAVTFGPLILLALLHPRVGTFPGFGQLSLAGFSGLFAAYCAVAATKGEAGLTGFPRGYSSLFAAALVTIDDQHVRDTHFEYLQANTPEHRMKKVIVIMDESVISSVFRAQQNGRALRNTYVHSGTVFSGANISAASNYYFRKAGLLPDRGVTQVASLFEQAKKAGYRTVYIDNQGVLKDRGAKNYMDATEVGFISQVIMNDKLVRHERDLASLRQLEEILRNDESTFVYVNKLGSHVPYATTIAPESRSGDRGEDYRRSVRINAVDYLARLMTAVGEDAVVVYTSDHGQNLRSGFSHGNSGDDATVNEWEVPFAVGSGNADFMWRLTASPMLGSSYLSHFDIAELVRNLLGYTMSGSLQVLADSGNRRVAREYCAYYGPPHGGIGMYSSGPKCRVWTLEDVVLARQSEESDDKARMPPNEAFAASQARSSGDAILNAVQPSPLDPSAVKASTVDAEKWVLTRPVGNTNGGRAIWAATR